MEGKTMGSERHININQMATTKGIGIPLPDRRTPPEALPQPKQGKEKKPMGLRKKIVLGVTAFAIAAAGVGTAVTAPKFLRSESNQSGQTETIPGTGLGPEQPVSWWQELPTEQIQKLAEVPSINIIDITKSDDLHKPSPFLQEKAKQAGYTLTYQGDPNDTVGRTVVAKGRYEWSIDWTMEDQGFGRAGTGVRGIFQAWAPDPQDPNQQDHIYAFLKNPNSGEEYVVRIELQPFDPNSPIRPTWFAVDDLNNGPSIIQEKSKAAGFDLLPEQIPTLRDPPDKKWKKLTDFPTFDDLLRRQGLSLTDLVKPGDYVIVGMQIAGVNETEGKHVYKTDDMKIARAIEVIVRRFGGEAQWKSELPKQ